MAERLATPAAPSVERAVLGAIMLWPDEAAWVVRQLSEDHFTRRDTKAVWWAIQEAYRKGTPPTLTVVQDILVAANRWNDVGSLTTLMEWQEEAISAELLEGYVEILEEKRAGRSLMQMALQLLELTQGSKSLEELAGEASRQFQQFLRGLPVGGSVLSLRELMEHVEEVIQTHGDDLGFPSGLPEIDTRLGKLEPGSLHFLIGYPGLGKTLVALALFRRQVLEYGLKVGFISLEMGPRALGLRIASAEARMSRRELIRARGAHKTWENAKRRLEEAGGYFTFGIRQIHEIYTKALQWIDQLGIQVLYIDHLQEIGCRKGGDSRVQQLEYIMQALKDIAIKGEIAVICLGQFNRKAMSLMREGSSPWYESIRDSSRIEQAADRILFLLRETDKDEVIWEADSKVDVVLRCIKNRNGPLGEIKLRLDYELQDIELVEEVPF